MQVYTLSEWEDRFDELIERVEKGETLGIRNEVTGDQAVFMPEKAYNAVLSHITDSPPE